MAKQIALPACKKCTKKIAPRVQFMIPSFLFGQAMTGIVKGEIVPTFQNVIPVWGCPVCGKRLAVTPDTADAWTIAWADVFIQLGDCVMKMEKMEEGTGEVVFQAKEGAN